MFSKYKPILLGDFLRNEKGLSAVHIMCQNHHHGKRNVWVSLNCSHDKTNLSPLCALSPGPHSPDIIISGIINIPLIITTTLIQSWERMVRVRLNCSHDKNNLSQEGKHCQPPHQLFALHERWSSSNSFSPFVLYEETEIISKSRTNSRIEIHSRSLQGEVYIWSEENSRNTIKLPRI